MHVRKLQAPLLPWRGDVWGRRASLHILLCFCSHLSAHAKVC